MRDSFPAVSGRIRALTSVAFVAALAGCAPPIVLDTPATQSRVVAPTLTDTAGAAPESTRVEVRYFSFSPTISVVSWATAENGYGLRASLRRDGSLVRDHRLYVSSYYVPWMYSFHLAAVPPRQLQRIGGSRDVYACYFGGCSPFETLGVRIPDDLLRSSRDSVAVTFFGREGRKMIITVRRDLIDAYLATVDSVSASLRKQD